MAKINIKLSYENGPVTIFNIKKSQEINKVVKLFAERKNMDMKDWVYQVNGRMIQLENESEEAQTAESLGLQNDDTINILKSTGQMIEESNVINLQIDYQGDITKILVKVDEALKSVMLNYCNLKILQMEKLRFRVDGSPLMLEDYYGRLHTARSLELENDCVIDIFMTCDGPSDNEETDSDLIKLQISWEQKPDTTTMPCDTITVKKNEFIGKVLKNFCNRKNISVDLVKFRLDGEALNFVDNNGKPITVGSLDIDESSSIDIFQRGDGGGFRILEFA